MFIRACVCGLNAAWLLWVAAAYIVSPQQGARMLPFTADSYAYDLSVQSGHLLDSVGRLDEAVASFRKSLEWDPRSAPTWLMLALSEERRGKADAAAHAYDQALRYEPGNADALWMRANLKLRQSRRDAAMADFDALLRLTRRFDAPVFQTLDQMIGLESSVARLPDDPVIHAGLLRYALGAGKRTAGLPIRPDATSLTASDIEAWSRQLLDEGAPEQAWSRWRHWASQRGHTPEDRVRNGSFEFPAQPPPFDWATAAGSRVRVFRDTAERRSGTASLHVGFSSAAGLLAEQWTVLQPNTQYRLTFWWKGRGLLSRAQPQFQVLQAGAGIAAVAASTGSWQWRQESITVRTGESAVVRLALVNPDAGSGTLWLDDVSLAAE